MYITCVANYPHSDTALAKMVIKNVNSYYPIRLNVMQDKSIAYAKNKY